jgi:hypothetical protein
MNSDPWQRSKWRNAVRLILLQLITPVVLAVFMFWPAGTLWWFRGWLFLLTFTVAASVATVILQRVNPDVVEARSRLHKGTKGWDKILMAFLFPSFLAIITVQRSTTVASIGFALTGGSAVWGTRCSFVVSRDSFGSRP